MSDNFFEKQTRSSKIKALIVSEYFPKYCTILNTKGIQNKIRFVDLYAGPGIYEDGNISTPIYVAQACLKNKILKNIVELLFNDNVHCEKLKENFLKSFPNGSFNYRPRFGKRTIGEDIGTTNYLKDKKKTEKGSNPHPTLLFIDPFGYKGVNTTSLAEFMLNWGNEIFLFVNIKRIHAAIENGKFDQLMKELFPTTFDQIRSDRKYTLSVQERLNLIIDNLANEYRIIIGDPLFYTAFKFKEEDSDATSHYILHFTKHPRGYDLVKQIYDEFDNIGAVLENNNTYSFDAKKLDNEKIQGTGFDFGDQNIFLLKDILKKEYSEKIITAEALFEEHQKTSRFAIRHYREALRSLVDEGIVFSEFTDKSDHKVSVLINKFCLLKFKKCQNHQ